MKDLFELTLRKQLVAGYVTIIIVAVAATSFCVSSLHANRKLDREISEVSLPFCLALKQLSLVIADMTRLTNNCIYQPTQNDKLKLIEHLDKTVPDAIDRVSKLGPLVNQGDVKLADKLLLFGEVTMHARKIMELLSVDSLYLNRAVMDKAITLLNQVSRPSEEIQAALSSALSRQQAHVAKAQVEKEKSYGFVIAALVSMIITFVLTAFIAYRNVTKKIVRPIVTLRDVLTDVGLGKITELQSDSRTDEIGQMYIAMAKLTSGLNSKSAFANEIGKGKYDEQFELLSEDDTMGKALITMRDNLKRSAEEERTRNWTVTGLAKFGELLRDQNQDIQKFADQVLAFTVKYITANQGRLYIVNDDSAADLHLQLIASYAWDKKKFIEQRIDRGQGLTGQCWEEGEAIFMKQVPDNYVKITSGLGVANPRTIFIAPLKTQDAVYGVLELASFGMFHDYEREFILRLTENLASAISTVRATTKTKLMLAHVQQQTEEMRSHEEEMRQNMEELSATQEEMQRKEKQYLTEIAMLKGITVTS
jgi:hypothetical protein